MEAVAAASSVIAIIEVAASSASRCLKYIRAVKNAEKDAKDLEAEVQQVQDLLEKAIKHCKSISEDDASILDDIYASAGSCGRQLSMISDKLLANDRSKLPIRLKLHRLKWPFERKEVKKLITELNRHKENIELAISISTGVRVEYSIALQKDFKKATSKNVLQKLPTAKDAAFDSFSDQYMRRCHQDTRLELLKEIRDWIQDLGGKHLLWLNGMAGTGKSTISRTVADENDRGKRLGASFFFKRGESDRSDASRLMSTLSVQLIEKFPEMLPLVQQALEADSRIFDKNLSDQFHKLILEPLKEISMEGHDTVVLVIDALDECESEEQATSVLVLLAKLRSISVIRVFLTSRPEPSIRRGFQMIPEESRRELILQENSALSIEHDIEIYLKDEFAKIRVDHPYLASDWPDEKRFKALLGMAIPLFIFASTMCRFIAHTRLDLPDNQLNAILKYKGTDQTDQLDFTYRPVLDRLVKGLTRNEEKTVVERFTNIIGLVIVLAEPLSTVSIARLLSKSEQYVRTALEELHSVLSIPRDLTYPVRLLHKSFHDYLLDNGKRDTNPFWIEEKAIHNRTAVLCVELLVRSDCLKQDICEIRHPGTPVSIIDIAQISKCLPLEVQYACRYWVHHLVHAKYSVEDDDYVHRFLQTKFLYWLEALCLIGRIYEAVHALITLQDLVNPHSRIASSFICDAQRFLGFSVEIISLFPLQLYTSSLVFAPHNSIIRTAFQSLVPGWITKSPKVETSWDPCLKTLTGHKDKISAVAFSPDGLQLATGCRGGAVRLWDAITGALQYCLEPHQYGIRSLVFSGGTLASVSPELIKTWDLSTGQLQHELRHTIKEAISEEVIFAANYVIACTHTPEMLIWDIEHGQLVHSVALDCEVTKLLSFESLVISCGRDKHIRFWDPVVGLVTKTIDTGWEHTDDICLYDNYLLSCSGNLKVWSLETMHLLRCAIDENEPVWQILHIGKDIISLTSTKIQLRDITSLEIKKSIDKAREDTVTTPDGRIMALTNMENHVRLSLPDTNAIHYLVGHSDRASCTAFSKDHKTLASGSSDTTVRIWDISHLKELHPTTPLEKWAIGMIYLSCDGRYVLLVLKGRRGVGLWNSFSQTVQYVSLDEHEPDIVAIAFSVDYEQAATGDEQGTILIWNPESLALRLVLRSNTTDPVTSLCFCSSGALLASGHYGGMIRIWRTLSGTLLQTLGGHEDILIYLNFSSEGQNLTSGSIDETVKLWTSTGGTFEQIESDEMKQSVHILDATVRQQFRKGENFPRQSRENRQLELRDDWIIYHDQKLLWLPYSYRPKARRFDSINNMVALSSREGEIRLLGLDLIIVNGLLEPQTFISDTAI